MRAHRPALVVALALVVAGLVAGCGSDNAQVTPSPTTTTSSGSPSGTPTPSASATPAAGNRVIVSLGDSLAAGYQPGKGDVRDTAYPARFAKIVSERGEPVALVNLGCSGETTAELVKGGSCTYPAGSQLAEAVAELTARQGHVAAVTLDIGGNDMLRCLSGSGPDTACGTRAVGEVADNLSTILTQLRAAAGPDTPIAVVLYYDPFSVLPILSVENKTAVRDLWGQLNGALSTAAAAQGATAVDLSGVFPPVDPASTPAANNPVCELTFMCTQGDFHLNDAGALAVAQAIGSALPNVR